MKYLENSAVNIKGAVSPAALAIANNMPVEIDLNAAGNVILDIIVNFEAPTPKAALRKSFETNFNASSVVLIIVGSIKIDREMPPAMALYFDPNKILVETIIAYINTPAIIEGTPASTLVPNLINFAKFPEVEYSARYIPPPTPIGIEIIEAIIVTINVPVIAGPIPPAERRSSPGGSGSSMSVSKLI